MALHDKDSIRHKLDDDIYGSSDVSVSLPKYQMPQEEHDHVLFTPWFTTN